MTVKSTPEQIRERFDNDVERFSNLETGQTATMDAPLVMESVAQAAARTNPDAANMLDVGCGAGNYTLKMLQYVPHMAVTLLDLSRPMLERARARVADAGGRHVRMMQGDVRDIELGAPQFDIILAAMVLHHLRGDDEWRAVFEKLYHALKPGGSLWIADHLAHAHPAIQEMMQARWGDYLTGLKGEAYRDHVFAYVEQEDTPRPLLFQTDLLREVGFTQVDVLHKNNAFAAFGAIKPAPAPPELGAGGAAS
ncbi:MAG: class I SAM-dependent methyltransferase [Armatimonadetes bacterium]|nr:class I SAM-dependent methyltransferase [Armatimonadota bacterium]